MSKTTSHLHFDEICCVADESAMGSSRMLSSLAFPLSILTALLLLDGALTTSITSAALGVLTLIAAHAIKARGL